MDLEFLKAALDDEETSRIDIENDSLLIIVDIPFIEMEDNSLTYDTYPLAIIHTDKQLITVCLKNSKILTDFTNDKIKSFYTFKKSRFTLQILNRISTYYLLYLRQIDKKSLMIVMKVLAPVTILMAIPTIIGGILEMNIRLPIFPDNPNGFPIVMGLTLGICGIPAFILYKKDMFK